MPDPSRTLKVAIPKGSLQEPTIELLAKAGYEVYVSSRGLRPSSNDPELDLYLIRAQEIGRYLGQGFIDCGITGYDWAYENEVDLIDLAELALFPRHHPADALGAGGAGGFADPQTRGSRRQAHRHRRRGHHQALPQGARHQCRSRVFLGCHRGQSAGSGRCHRGCHRDRFLDQGQPPAHRGHAADVVSALLRQARPPPRILGKRRKWTASPCCSKPRSAPAAKWA